MNLLPKRAGLATNEAVHCTLEYHSLVSDIRYHALSYTWGDPSITTKIVLDGDEFDVTTNLGTALTQLRDDGYTKLWVDAVCLHLDRPQTEPLRKLRFGPQFLWGSVLHFSIILRGVKQILAKHSHIFLFIKVANR